MSGVVEVAGSILARSFERAEISAQNITNMTTPGYKAQRWYPLAEATASSKSGGTGNSTIDLSPGQFQTTANPFDLAISGSGFFVVRSADGTYYTRDGQFTRGEDGKIVTPGGLAMQDAAGGDLVVQQNNPQILSDGTVLVSGQPVARIAIADIADGTALRPTTGGLFTAADDAVTDGSATIHQGMLETSNVSTADEMISIMASLRSAESGQKVLQVYDDLMARTIDAFGQA